MDNNNYQNNNNDKNNEDNYDKENQYNQEQNNQYNYGNSQYSYDNRDYQNSQYDKENQYNQEQNNQYYYGSNQNSYNNRDYQGQNGYNQGRNQNPQGFIGIIIKTSDFLENMYDQILEFGDNKTKFLIAIAGALSIISGSIGIHGGIISAIAGLIGLTVSYFVKRTIEGWAVNSSGGYISPDELQDKVLMGLAIGEIILIVSSIINVGIISFLLAIVSFFIITALYYRNIDGPNRYWQMALSVFFGQLIINIIIIILKAMLIAITFGGIIGRFF